jgi:hypothetical protein
MQLPTHITEQIKEATEPVSNGYYYMISYTDQYNNKRKITPVKDNSLDKFKSHIKNLCSKKFWKTITVDYYKTNSSVGGSAFSINIYHDMPSETEPAIQSDVNKSIDITSLVNQQVNALRAELEQSNLVYQLTNRNKFLKNKYKKALETLSRLKQKNKSLEDELKTANEEITLLQKEYDSEIQGLNGIIESNNSANTIGKMLLTGIGAYLAQTQPQLLKQYGLDPTGIMAAVNSISGSTELGTLQETRQAVAGGVVESENEYQTLVIDLINKLNENYKSKFLQIANKISTNPNMIDAILSYFNFSDEEKNKAAAAAQALNDESDDDLDLEGESYEDLDDEELEDEALGDEDLDDEALGDEDLEDDE